MSAFVGEPVLIEAVDDLAVTSTWSRRGLEMWCRIARVIARRRGLNLDDGTLSKMLRMAVEVSTTTGWRAGSPEEITALFAAGSGGATE